MGEVIEVAKRILKSIRRTEDEYGVTYELASGGFIGLQEPYLVASALLLLAEPEWGEPTDDGWYWLEELADDAPPQKVAKHSLGVDSEGRDIQPIWRRWMIAGWVDLKGRVAPCVGRPRKAGE